MGLYDTLVILYEWVLCILSEIFTLKFMMDYFVSID